MRLQTKLLAGALLSLAVSHAAFAAPISGPGQITTATATTPGMGPWGGFTIDQMIDGNKNLTGPFNGYTTNAAAGTIRLDLDAHYDITQFRLWNDINVRAEGVKDFTLNFYNNMTLVGSHSGVAGFGQIAVQQFTFPVKSNVNRVDLVVTSSHNEPNTYRQRIEIREVEFEGVPHQLPPPNVPGDHFQCYRVEKGDRVKAERIVVKDQFGQSMIMLGKPKILCNPSSKIHNGKEFPIENKERHLVCYDIMRQSNAAGSRDKLEVSNQFGYDDIYARRREMFCVPSYKKHLDRGPAGGLGEQQYEDPGRLQHGRPKGR